MVYTVHRQTLHSFFGQCHRRVITWLNCNAEYMCCSLALKIWACMNLWKLVSTSMERIWLCSWDIELLLPRYFINFHLKSCKLQQLSGLVSNVQFWNFKIIDLIYIPKPVVHNVFLEGILVYNLVETPARKWIVRFSYSCFSKKAITVVNITWGEWVVEAFKWKVL